MNYVDLKIPEDVLPEAIECCLEWGITVSCTTCDGLRRFFGEPEELHVLKSIFEWYPTIH